MIFTVIKFISQLKIHRQGVPVSHLETLRGGRAHFNENFCIGNHGGNVVTHSKLRGFISLTKRKIF